MDRIIPGNDQETNVPVVLDYPEHQMNEGNAFLLSSVSAVASDGDFHAVTIVTPNTNKRLRAKFEGWGVGATIMRIYEGAAPDVNSLGTVATPINKDRNSATTSVASCRVNDLFTDAGSKGSIIFPSYLGAGVKGGSLHEQRNPLVLKKNTIYMIELESDSDGNFMTGIVDWTEATSKKGD